MKKILSSIIILCIVLSICSLSNAANGSIEFNFTGDESEIEQGTKTVTYKISLGKFEEITENPMMGYEAVLDYDSDVFKSVSIEGLNGWTAQYSDSTKRLIGETQSKGEEYKEIAKITLTLKDDAPATTTSIKLKKVVLSVNGVDEYDYEKEVSLKIKEKASNSDNDSKDDNSKNDNNKNDNKQEEKNDDTSKEDKKDNTKTGENTVVKNVISPNTTTNNSKTANQSQNNSTTATTKLPKTGITTIAVIAIVVLITGVGCLIKYKTIQIK